MKIVVWSLNDGNQHTNLFFEKLTKGLKEDPDELHIIHTYKVEATEVEIPTDGFQEDEYKICIISDTNNVLIKLNKGDS